MTSPTPIDTTPCATVPALLAVIGISNNIGQDVKKLIQILESMGGQVTVKDIGGGEYFASVKRGNYRGLVVREDEFNAVALAACNVFPLPENPAA